MKKDLLKKTLYTALMLNIVLTAIILLLIIISIFDINPGFIKSNFTVFLSLIGISFLINIYILLKLVRMNLLISSRFTSMEKSMSQIEKLNNSLRSQRHDFLNHLQIVFGLIELREFKEAAKYIKDIYTDIQSISRILKTSHPAINALIQAKTGTAEENNIALKLNIQSRLQPLPMDPWEICRIMSNIIDNAIESLRELHENRKLEISITENIKSFIIKIIDNGPQIPENIKDRIFEPGFSTNSSEGKGMGLAIVNDIVKRYDCKINFNSNSDLTEFKIEIPRKSQKNSQTVS
jgi:two-component system sensor histidine kinase AgrC